MSDPCATLTIMSGDGFEWIQSDLAPTGFCLVMVEAVGAAELATMLGADPDIGTLPPEVFNPMRHRALNIPDWARPCEYAGWAFALLGGGDGFYRLRPDHVRHLWEGRTYVEVEDTTMDPPTISVVVDGEFDWSYYEGEVHEHVRADHPLTRRMTAELGLGGAVPDPDFPDDPDEWGLYVPDVRDVYRLTAEHYGLSLPRETILAGSLPAVFTSPRVYANGERNTRYDNVTLPQNG